MTSAFCTYVFITFLAASLLAYDCMIVSLYSDFHSEEKCTVVMQTGLVVSGNEIGDDAVRKMGI